MKTIHRFTVEEKVGQIFFLGFNGPAPDPETQAMLDFIRPGGFVLSRRNIESLDQLYGLTQRLTDGNALPAFVAVAQEGAPVDRLKPLFGALPPLRSVADAGMTHLRQFARIIALESQAAGFNTVLAPVLDLSVPGAVMCNRAFSTDPLETSRLAAAFCEELHNNGVLACGKHFPGLGAARTDPHFGLPRIGKSRRELLQEDVVPFLNLLDVAPMLMVGHAYYPDLMDGRPAPASLSPRIVESLLRRKYGFHGVIVTDDLAMGAVNSLGLTSDLFLQAFEAGNDMMLFSQTTPLVERAFRALCREFRKSPAFRARLDQSVQRIRSLKQRMQPASLRFRFRLQRRIERQIDRLTATIDAQARFSAARVETGPPPL